MKKIIVSLILLAVTTSYGQELNLPVSTQYLADNPFVISPTFAGIGDNVRIRVNGLTQWVGIKDAPQNQSVYADFRVLDQSGVGISFYNDKNGNTRQTGGKLSFAHHIILDYYSKQYFSMGISYNINNFRIDIDKLDPTDPSITDNRSTSNNNFDVGALYRRGSFYLNFNVGNILNKDIEKFYMTEPDLLRNYQIYTGYVFSLSENRNELEPSAYYQLYESDGRSSTDLTLKYRIMDNNDDYYWGGLTYRFLNDQVLVPLDIGPMVGLKKRGFYVGYSYQIVLNEISAYNSGTHMVTLGYDFLQGLSNCPCTRRAVHDE